MNARVDIRMSRDQFLDWLLANPSARAELSRGRLQMMNFVSLFHARVVGSAYEILRAAFPRASHDVTTESYAVDTSPDTVRFPDVTVFARNDDGNARGTAEPLLVVEVLSTWSMARDLREKPNEYLALPSLQAYLVLSSTDVAAWLWVRGDDGFEAEPTLIEGAGAAIDIPALGFAATLGAVYAATGIG